LLRLQIIAAARSLSIIVPRRTDYSVIRLIQLVAPDNLSIALCDRKARLALHLCNNSLLCFFVSLVFHLRSVARLVSLSYPIFPTTTTSRWPRSCAGSSYPLGLLLSMTDKHLGMA
jgi:hypothetical protein